MLISVKDSAEARIVAACPDVSIVDLKDPSAGALGFAGSAVANEVIAAITTITRRMRVSIACGELHQWSLAPHLLPPQQDHIHTSRSAHTAFSTNELEKINWSAVAFVKVGLSGYSRSSAVRQPLQDFFSLVPTHVRRVLVIYVDLLSPSQAEKLIGDLHDLGDDGLSVLLLDTFDKNSGNTFAHYSSETCQGLFQQARAAGMTGVLAGSIEIADLVQAAATGADLIGVRGAVCRENVSTAPQAGRHETRKNSLCPRRLEQFLDAARMILAQSIPVR